MRREISEMLSALSRLHTLDERIDWLDRTGWLMPRDALALGEMMDAQEQRLLELSADSPAAA